MGPLLTWDRLLSTTCRALITYFATDSVVVGGTAINSGVPVRRRYAHNSFNCMQPRVRGATRPPTVSISRQGQDRAHTRQHTVYEFSFPTFLCVLM